MYSRSSIPPMISPITTKGQLGPLLMQLRRSHGLSQAALGSKLGLSQERISRIERYPEKMTVDQLITVLMALDAALCVAGRDELPGAAKRKAPKAKGAAPGEEW